MIDPKQAREKKIKDLTKENKALREKVDHAQRELVDSVRAEIELGAEISRLRLELADLRRSSQPKEIADMTNAQSKMNQELVEYDHGA